MLNLMEYQVKLLTNKARFILEQCDGKIDLRKKKKEAVIALLKERNYDVMDEDEEYKYLRGMRIEQVEEENVEKLLKDKDEKMAEYEILKKTTLKEMWKKELKELKSEFEKYQRARRVRQYGKKGKK
jgi:DNA topoisomerase-2